MTKDLTLTSIQTASGLQLPRLGQGTWFLGDVESKRQDELAALHMGVDLGMTLIDTAQMYGEGRSELLVGELCEQVDRDRLVLVSKVYPHNADRKQLPKSCEQSLRRMKTEYLDLYLLHWRGIVPLEETVEAMEKLVARQLIRGWGVSNFDVDDMEELWSVPGGTNCAVNQVLYHLASRGIEYDLLPALRSRSVPFMAYCPIAQGGNLDPELYTDSRLQDCADKYGISIAQLLLAFVFQNPDVIALPRSGNPAHTALNAAAADIRLEEEDLRLLDSYYPPPRRRVPLDIV